MPRSIRLLAVFLLQMAVSRVPLAIRLCFFYPILADNYISSRQLERASLSRGKPARVSPKGNQSELAHADNAVTGGR